MLTRVAVFITLSFVGSLSAATVTDCGPAIILASSVRRGYFDAKMLSTQSRYVRSLVNGKNTPIEFKVSWINGKAYLHDPKFNVWMTVNGDVLDVAFDTSEHTAARLTLLLPPEFVRSSLLSNFWLTSDKERKAFFDWYSANVGSFLLQEAYKGFAAKAKSQELSFSQWQRFIEMAALFAPNGMLLASATPTYDRYRLTARQIEGGRYVIELRTRVSSVSYAAYRFDQMYESWGQPICDEKWTKTLDEESSIRVAKFQSCRLSADLFSIARHRDSYPSDTLEDVLQGIPEYQGDYILELDAGHGAFALNEKDETAKRWKRLLEAAISSSKWDYVPAP